MCFVAGVQVDTTGVRTVLETRQEPRACQHGHHLLPGLCTYVGTFPKKDYV